MTTASGLAIWRSIARRSRAVWSGERGVALPMAVVTLSIVTGLAGVTVMVATQGNDSQIRDSNVKAADEAAESALDVATYRLNMIQPTSGNCITSNVSTATPASGWCQDASTETLGNGGSFTYWDSGASPSSCVGYTLVNQAGLTQRCITAQATVNGVTRRTEARVAEFAATPLFPAAGVIGLNGVTLSGNANISGVSATNKTLSASGNATSNGGLLGPSGNVSTSGNAKVGTVVQRTAAQGPLVLSPVNPGNSATTNDDYRITNAMASPVVTPDDPVSSPSSVSWSATKRTLTLSGNSAITLGGGTYNFCSLSVSGNAKMSLGAGVKVQIFIDSANRSGSGCASGSGGLTLSGNALANSNTDPTALQLYVYDGSGGAVTISGNGTMYGTLYAPSSSITLSGNGGAFDGAIAGLNVTVSGNGFTWDTRDATLSAGTSGLYYRTAWEECQAPSSTTLNTPAAGC